MLWSLFYRMQKLDNELWNIEEARGSRDGFYKNIENIMDGDENKL